MYSYALHSVPRHVSSPRAQPHIHAHQVEQSYRQCYNVCRVSPHSFENFANDVEAALRQCMCVPFTPPPQEEVPSGPPICASSRPTHVECVDDFNHFASAQAPQLPSPPPATCQLANLPKLPPFKPARAKLWFDIVDDIFDNCDLDDLIRYLCLVSNLYEHEDLISDLIGKPAHQHH